jgi:ParB-like chromosome segregation protein Spo0J
LTGTTPEAVKRQLVKLDDLKPHPRNYNVHSDAQIARIAKSLQTFGQVRSIVTWRKTILAGHGVVLAASTLGWTELRADDVSHLSEDEALAYVVADNELARQSDPDQAQLAAILEELQAREPLLVEAAGYSQMELEQLLRSVNGNDANGAGIDNIPEQWAVMVQCTTEIEQADLLQRLESEGYSCRALIS